jgi:hypothetical protein
MLYRGGIAVNEELDRRTGETAVACLKYCLRTLDGPSKTTECSVV